jgi:hypothetical protein
MINITHAEEKGSEAMIPAALSLGYSREYQYNTTNRPLLESIAAAAGGAVLKPSDTPFKHDLKASPMITPVWPYLVILAALLFPVEIFIRRVVINYAAIYAPVIAVLKKLPGLGRMMPKKPASSGPVTGWYGAAGAPSEDTASEEIRRSFGSAPEESPIVAEKAQKEIIPERPKDEDREVTSRLLAAKEKVRERQRRKSAKDKDDK